MVFSNKLVMTLSKKKLRKEVVDKNVYMSPRELILQLDLLILYRLNE